MLLVDFLGSHADPSDREALLMDSALANEATRLRAFKALAGSEGWFRRLADGPIAEAMRSEETQANAQMEVLTRALPQMPDAVVRLIRDNWLPNRVNDLRSWSVLQWIPRWTDEALSLALTIIGRTDMSSSAIDHRAGSIAVEQPEAALRLIRARLDRELNEAVAQSEFLAVAAVPSRNGGATKEMQVAERLADRVCDPIRNLLERNSEWDSSFWTPDQVRRFEERVRSFAPPPPSDEIDPKGRMSWRHRMRRTQLDLLRALPARQRSPEAARQVNEDERRYGGNRSGASFSGVRMIGSVLEADAMAKASDDDIVNAFAELPDATGWDNPKNWMAGGNIQLARAFATFSKDHMDRAIRILSRLDPSNGTRATAYAIDALSEDAPPEMVFDLVRSAVGRGFEGEEFRHSIARALDRMARREIEVAEDLIELLEQWVVNLPAGAEDDVEAQEAEQEDDVAGEELDSGGPGPVEQSSLWGHRGFGVFPGGDVPVADAVVHIRLLRGQVELALAFLSRYLDRQKGIQAWDLLASYLPHLANAEPSQRVAFLDRVFSEVGVVGSKPYAEFLAWSERADHNLVERHIDAWRDSPSASARQAYGEIVALDAMLRPDHFSSVERLERIMGDPSERHARAGAALSAAHVLVEEPTRREAAASLLVRSLKGDEPGCWAAALELFRLSDELPADDATRKVLRALADGLPRSPKIDATFIVDRLATLLPHEASIVGEIALGLVSKWDTDLGDIRTATAMAASALVDLALTLHRLGPETREVGLQLFERLIRIDAYEARQTLDEIDNRFRPSAPVARSRLRRRSEVATRQRRRR